SRGNGAQHQAQSCLAMADLEGHGPGHAGQPRMLCIRDLSNQLVEALVAAAVFQVQSAVDQFQAVLACDQMISQQVGPYQLALFVQQQSCHRKLGHGIGVQAALGLHFAEAVVDTQGTDKMRYQFGAERLLRIAEGRIMMPSSETQGHTHATRDADIDAENMKDILVLQTQAVELVLLQLVLRDDFAEDHRRVRWQVDKGVQCVDALLEIGGIDAHILRIPLLEG